MSYTDEQLYKAGSPYKDGEMDEEPLFRLKLSEYDKYKNKAEWFKTYADYIVPEYNITVDDYDRMKRSFDLINNNLDGFMPDIKKFCNPLGIEIGQTEEELKPYNKLHNKLSVVKGEVLKRGDDYRIVLLNDKLIKDKNEALLQEIGQSVEEKLSLKVEEMKAQMQGMTPEQAQEMIQQMRVAEEPADISKKNFLSEHEIFYSKILKFCYYDQNIKFNKAKTIEDAYASDRTFIYSGWKHGKPIIIPLNPLYVGFHKSPEVKFIQHGDYAWSKRAVTISDAYDKYINVLSKEDFHRLGTYNHSNNNQVDKRHDVMGKAKYVHDHTNELMWRDSQEGGFADKRVGGAMGQGLDRQYNQDRLIWETHIEFKAYRQILFITFKDDYGKEITEAFDDKYPIPKDAMTEKFVNDFGDMSKRYIWTDKMTKMEFSAEKLWIPRRYEVTRLGESIYVNMREVPNQPLDINRPYSSFELSYKGAIYSNNNSDSISPVERATPYVFQYFFVKHIQNRELAKYQGYNQDIDVDQIPDELGMDDEGNGIRDKVSTFLHYQRMLGKTLYSGSQNSMGGMPPSTRSPGTQGYMLGTSQEIINLQNLLELIDREIGMVMGISPEREANFTRGTNVSDNRQSIMQSHHITEYYFYLHNEIWKSAINDYLKNFVTYYREMFIKNPGKKEHFIHYITPSGSEELIKVTPELLNHNDIGLYLSNSGESQVYIETMKQLTHAFAQNAGEGLETVSALLKSITSGASPEEVHKMISLESDKQSKRRQEMENRQMEIQQQMQQKELEAKEDEQAHEIEKIQVKGQIDKEIKAMDVYKFIADLDANQNNIPDHLEALKMVEQGAQKDRELSIKENETSTKADLEQQKVDLEREKMESNERIEKEKTKRKATD